MKAQRKMLSLQKQCMTETTKRHWVYKASILSLFYHYGNSVCKKAMLWVMINVVFKCFVMDLRICVTFLTLFSQGMVLHLNNLIKSKISASHLEHTYLDVFKCMF